MINTLPIIIKEKGSLIAEIEWLGVMDEALELVIRNKIAVNKPKEKLKIDFI